MKKKGRRAWLNLLDKSEVLTLLLGIRGLPTVFILITSSPPSEGTSPRFSFPQAVPRVGAGNFALYDRGSGKRDRQIPGDVRKNEQVRLPLTWSILAHEYLTVTSSQKGGDVTWLGLALSYFLLCRASELFACANWLVHPDFCLTPDCLTFFRGDVQGNIED